MKITDLAPVEAWEALERELHDKYRLNAAVNDAEGKRVTGYANWCNELCPRIKGDPRGLTAICAVAGRHFSQYCTDVREPLVDECDACLTKVAVPVMKNGEYLGCAGGCGALMRGAEVETFLVSKSLEMDEEEAERLAASAPELTPDSAAEIVDFLERRLVEMGADPVRA